MTTGALGFIPGLAALGLGHGVDAVENGLTVGCQGPTEHSEEYDRWRQASHSRCYFLATALPPMVRVTWGIGIPFSVINLEIRATASA